MTDSLERLGKCEVCAAENVKYTCPKCEVKTCCLKCINIHKKELNCDGIRDPTKFIKLNNFTNVDVLNDYRMLEQVGRVVDGLQKNPLPREFKFGRRLLPKHLNKLQIALEKRKINIKFLPKNFEKRKKNKTFMHRHKNLVYWDIEWVFKNAEISIFEHGCCESLKLSSVLHKYLNGQVADFQNEKLHFYQASGMSNVVLLLKAENVRGEKYYELDLTESIRENLARKTIVEYPTIYVVLKGHEYVFETIDTDCEDDEMEVGEETKKRVPENEGNVVLAQLLNQAAKNDVEKSKNLLFITEYSDAELSTDEENT